MVFRCASMEEVPCSNSGASTNPDNPDNAKCFLYVSSNPILYAKENLSESGRKAGLRCAHLSAPRATSNRSSWRFPDPHLKSEAGRRLRLTRRPRQFVHRGGLTAKPLRMVRPAIEMRSILYQFVFAALRLLFCPA